jgi:hypothetical protein
LPGEQHLLHPNSLEPTDESELSAAYNEISVEIQEIQSSGDLYYSDRIDRFNFIVDLFIDQKNKENIQQISSIKTVLLQIKDEKERDREANRRISTLYIELDKLKNNASADSFYQSIESKLSKINKIMCDYLSTDEKRLVAISQIDAIEQFFMSNQNPSVLDPNFPYSQQLIEEPEQLSRFNTFQSSPKKPNSYIGYFSYKDVFTDVDYKFYSPDPMKIIETFLITPDSDSGSPGTLSPYGKTDVPDEFNGYFKLVVHFKPKDDAQKPEIIFIPVKDDDSSPKYLKCSRLSDQHLWSLDLPKKDDRPPLLYFIDNAGYAHEYENNGILNNHSNNKNIKFYMLRNEEVKQFVNHVKSKMTEQI